MLSGEAQLQRWVIVEAAVDLGHLPESGAGIRRLGLLTRPDDQELVPPFLGNRDDDLDDPGRRTSSKRTPSFGGARRGPCPRSGGRCSPRAPRSRLPLPVLSTPRRALPRATFRTPARNPPIAEPLGLADENPTGDGPAPWRPPGRLDEPSHASWLSTLFRTPPQPGVDRTRRRVGRGELRGTRGQEHVDEIVAALQGLGHSVEEDH